MTEENPICPSCGKHSRLEALQERAWERARRIEQEMIRQAAAHAAEKAHSWLELLRAREHGKYHQRKAARQSQVIQRLEKKLRAAGLMPYAKDTDTPKDASK